MNQRVSLVALSLLLVAACADENPYGLLSDVRLDAVPDVFTDVSTDATDTSLDAEDGSGEDTSADVPDAEPECVTDDECEAGFVCAVGGVCLPEEAPVGGYVYVAVLSAAVDPSAFEGTNPGPDIDAILVNASGRSYGPAEVVAFEDGPLQGADENTRTNPDAVLVDDVRDDGDNFCEFDDPELADYYSLGGMGGLVVVRFPAPIDAQVQLVVIELDDQYCSGNDGLAVRAEPYTVYVSNDLSTLENGTATEVQSSWCLAGASGGNGGVTTLQLDPATDCPL